MKKTYFPPKFVSVTVPSPSEAGRISALIALDEGTVYVFNVRTETEARPTHYTAKDLRLFLEWLECVGLMGELAVLNDEFKLWVGVPSGPGANWRKCLPDCLGGSSFSRRFEKEGQRIANHYQIHLWFSDVKFDPQDNMQVTEFETEKG